MAKHKKNGIGILGGTFDPAHKGHVKISKIAIRKLRLKKIYWVITKKNPFKKNLFIPLETDLLAQKKLLKISKILKFYIWTIL